MKRHSTFTRRHRRGCPRRHRRGSACRTAGYGEGSGSCGGDASLEKRRANHFKLVKSGVGVVVLSVDNSDLLMVQRGPR
jgi:hypothetical protein